jgi:amidohydrolase
MIARGLLDLDPTPDAAFALHGWPGQTAGTVSAAPGPTMAAADSFVVRIRGQGAHGAQPQRSKDPVVAAAQAICTLQTLASRSVDPLQPFVLSVCSLHGGTTRNVIPAEVQFEGTVRCFDPELRSFVRIRMEEILAGICTANGCHHSLEIIEGYSPLVNDPRMVAAARAIVTTALGPEHWSEDHRPSMASEDFAYYLERVPGCMLRLGLGQDSPPLHHPGFDFNDEVLETGISLMVALALGLSGAWDPRARL